MKCLIYEAKTSFLKLKIHVDSEKIVRNFLGTPRVLIFKVVADHRYHSSRSKWRCWDFPDFPNPSNFKHL